MTDGLGHLVHPDTVLTVTVLATWTARPSSCADIEQTSLLDDGDRRCDTFQSVLRGRLSACAVHRRRLEVDQVQGLQAETQPLAVF